jgi:hypothetical protein
MIKRFVWIVCFVLGGASLGWADSATRPATQPVADEKPLGRLGDYESVKIIVVSDDENRVAFVGVRGQQQWVVRDGVPAGPYDWVIPRSVAMSPGGSRCAFIVQTASQTIAVVDGKPCAPCYGIGQNRVLLPRYGKRFAYVAIGDAGKGASMVADGINGPTFDDVQWPLFSPDGVHLAYGAKQGKQQMIVLDGHPQKAYDSIAEYSLVFSRDSRRLAYRAVVAGKTVMVCDQTESKPYDLMRLGPGFSPDSMHLAGVVEEHGKTFAVIDGAEGRPYDGLLTGDFTFSPDSKHVAYAMKLGQKNLVIRDGVDQEQFDAVGNSTVSFSDDSRHLVYEGVNLGKSSIVFDNQKLDAFDGADGDARHQPRQHPRALRGRSRGQVGDRSLGRASASRGRRVPVDSHAAVQSRQPAVLLSMR